MPDAPLAVALPIAVLSALAIVLAAGRPFRVSRAPIAIGLFGTAMVTLGTGSYYATQFLFPSYYAPIESALLLTAIGFVMCALGVFVTRHFGRRGLSTPRWEWRAAQLDIVIYALLAISIVGTLAAIRRIGYIPILRGDIREERLTYADQLGILYTMSVMSVPAMILGGARLLAFGRSLLSGLALVVGTLCSGLYGPRFFTVVGIATIFVLYDQFRRRVALWKLALVGVVVVPALIGVAMYRESDLPAAAPLVTLSYLSFGEFRDFAWSLQYYDDPAHRIDGETIPGAVVPLLPAKLWSLVGVDKEALYERSSAQVIAELMKVEVGIRIGIVGELFMNFGIGGVLVGMLLFGVLAGVIDHRLWTGSLTTANAPFFALLTVLAVFALVGQLNMFGSSISVFGYPLLIAALFASARPVPRAGPADREILI